jgi:hypothetical protein
MEILPIFIGRPFKPKATEVNSLLDSGEGVTRDERNEQSIYQYESKKIAI